MGNEDCAHGRYCGFVGYKGTRMCLGSERWGEAEEDAEVTVGEEEGSMRSGMNACYRHYAGSTLSARRISEICGAAAAVETAVGWSMEEVASGKCISDYHTWRSERSDGTTLDECFENCKRQSCKYFSYDSRGRKCYYTKTGSISGTCSKEVVYQLKAQNQPGTRQYAKSCDRNEDCAHGRYCGFVGYKGTRMCLGSERWGEAEEDAEVTVGEEEGSMRSGMNACYRHYVGSTLSARRISEICGAAAAVETAVGWSMEELASGKCISDYHTWRSERSDGTT